MAQVLVMPKQGNTVESCVIIEWCVKEGDTVDANTTVCEAETDKATVEVPAGVAGTVLKILHSEGEDVPVMQPIMIIGNAGEDWKAVVGDASQSGGESAQSETPASAVVADNTSASGSDSASASASETAAPATVTRASGEHIAISPRARTLAMEEAVQFGNIAGSGPGGRIIEQDIKAVIASRPPLTEAAKDALRKGAALPATGSGIGGRVTLADIEAFAASGGASASTSTYASAGAAETADSYIETPIKGIRKVIADRMMSSLETMAQFTLNASASAVHLQEFRARIKACGEDLGFGKVTVNDIILFAASRMLPLFPYMNAHKIDGKIREYKNVHLGVAVDTPRGLMVPVIRNADKMSLAQISAKAKALGDACQNGTIKPDELTGSTLTVSNLGSTGIESFTPVINAPEVAILGVCGISPKPVANAAGSYDIVPHIGFSLTIDHAAVDGAPAARFLKAFCNAIANIDVWIAK